MWWNAIAGGAAALDQLPLTNANIDARNRVNAANADARNRTRAAGNELTAAQGNLERWVQSLNNQRRLEAAGDALDAHVTNYYRQADAVLAGNFESSIRDAEEEGAALAAQAATGIGGDTVDLINAATSLRQARSNEAAAQFKDTMQYDAALRASDMMQQAVQGLDSSIIMDSLDYGIDVAAHEEKYGKFATALRGAHAGMGYTGEGGNQKPDSPRGDSSVYLGNNRMDTSRDRSVWNRDGSVDYSLGTAGSFRTSNGHEGLEFRAANADTNVYNNDGSTNYSFSFARQSSGFRLGGD